jgi:hypothetical protein
LNRVPSELHERLYQVFTDAGIVELTFLIGFINMLNWFNNALGVRYGSEFDEVTLFTGRLPLVAAWVGGFILQGVVRATVFGTPFFVPLVPMISAAFIIFTLYMIPDPATTPLKPTRQALFGFSVAMAYGTLQVFHLVFGLFFALLIVCAIHGLSLHVWALLQKVSGDAEGARPAVSLRPG